MLETLPVIIVLFLIISIIVFFFVVYQIGYMQGHTKGYRNRPKYDDHFYKYTDYDIDDF